MLLFKAWYDRVEKHGEALNDANHAIIKKKNSTKAIAAKAEALYSSGNFEKSLVQFEKGSRIHKNVDILKGLKKSKQAILNTLACNELQMCSNTVDDFHEDIANKKDVNAGTKETSEIDTYLRGLAGRKIRGKKKTNKKYNCLEQTKLNISNLLKEEEIFLKSLKEIEKFNLKINVKRGSEILQSKVEFCFESTFSIFLLFTYNFFSYF